LDLTARKQIAQNYYGGLQNTFEFKGIQLDIFFQFVQQSGYNYLMNFQRPGSFGPQGNQLNFILNNWERDGDVSKVQKFSQSPNSSAALAFTNFKNSDALIGDASFIRLKTLSISYKIPITNLNKSTFKNFEIYVQSQNLMTITKYLGLDPENQGYVPPIRTLTFGLRLGL
jgi:hypothetical protein